MNIPIKTVCNSGSMISEKTAIGKMYINDNGRCQVIDNSSLGS